MQKLFKSRSVAFRTNWHGEAGGLSNRRAEDTLRIQRSWVKRIAHQKGVKTPADSD
jgi:hypothetical protein